MSNTVKNKRLYGLSSKTDYFSRNMFKRQFGSALVASVGLGFADMADSIVLGHSMGITGLAAISLVLPIFMIINIIMHGFGAGGCIIYSNLKAEGKNDDAKASFQSVISCAVLIGIIMAILGNVFLPYIVQILGASKDDILLYNTTCLYARVIICATPLFFITYILYYYLRNDDYEKFANYIFTIGNIIDLVLNVVFVLFLNMGVIGAALSTVIGVSFMTVCYLYIVLFKNTGINFSKYKPNFINSFKCFRLGFSSSIYYLFSMIFLLIANNVLMHMSGGIGVAVLDVVQNSLTMVIYIFDAINKSSQPIFSTYHGEKNDDGCVNVLHFINKIVIVVGLLLILVFFAFPSFICLLFGLNQPDSLDLGKFALRIFGTCIIFLGINSVFENYFQSCMYEKSAYFISILRTFIVLIPSLFVCSFLGIKYIWIMYPLTELITLIIVYIFITNGKLEEDDFDSNRVYKKTISNSIDELTPLFDDIDVFCEKYGASVSQNYLVKLAVEELCNIVMTRAFEEDGGFVQITILATEDNSFELHFRDSASKFNLFDLETKRAIEEDFDVDLMGILMVKKKAKAFSYRHFQGFNSYIVNI